ncbi:MAG: gliding motility-associated C-terminal domain-containing protein [Bacteroidia bacterium]
MPNAFSPNGDGQNDVLLVRGYNIAAMHLLIYDRWGGLMFESNDQANGWDGTFKGQAVSTAVFAYSFQATLANGSEKRKKGNISLIR